MLRKVLLPFVPAGIIVGFLYGLFSAFSATGAQDWFSQKLYWLILADGVSLINRSTSIALVLALFVSLIVMFFVLLWKKYFNRFFEVNITTKIDSLSWKRGFWTFALLSLSVFLFIQHAAQKIQMVPLVVSQAIILLVLCLLLFSKKKNAQSEKNKRASLLGPFTLKRLAAASVVLLVLANLLHFTRRQFFKPTSPNVLFIVVDTLRADHLGCYGYSRLTSPNIDRFAQKSILFENHISNSPWTKPSMGTIFTSLYPHEHLAFSWLDNLSDSSVTVAEVFLNENYATVAVQTNPCLSTENNFAQGFQDYMDLPQGKGGQVTDTFLSWVEDNGEKPFFAYLHYMDTHMPYNAPEEFRHIFGLDDIDPNGSLDLISLDIRVLTELGIAQDEKQSVIDLYDNAVLQFDRSFERILQGLNKNNLLDNTIILLTSDHGEEFWEHKSFGHGHTHYNELLHVPLIIGNAPRLSSRRISHFTQHLDVFPSILSLANIKKTPFQRDEDKTPLLLTQEKNRNDLIFFEAMLSGKEKWGVIRGSWKLIENTNRQCEGVGATLGDLEKFRGPQNAGLIELYDLTQDPLETTNLSSRFTDLSHDLKTLILRNFSTEVRLTQHSNKELEKKTEGLKALGYIK